MMTNTMNPLTSLTKAEQTIHDVTMSCIAVNVRNIIILQYPCQIAIYRTYQLAQRCYIYLVIIIPNYNVQNLFLLQTLWQEFKASFSKTAAGVLQEESEPQAGMSTGSNALSHPRVL